MGLPGFYIAKPDSSRHVPRPSEPMIRLLTCSILACLAASCVPQKAILVEGPPPEKPKVNKPAAGQEPVFVVQPQNQRRMRQPNPAQVLPDDREFLPTAQNSGGTGLIVSPPGNRTSPPPPPAENKPSE